MLNKINLIKKLQKWAEEKFDDWYSRELLKCEVGISNSDSRDQWVIGRLSEISPGLQLLDAGSGEQKYRAFCKHLKYVSQDHNAYDGKGDGLGGHLVTWKYAETDIICDIASIPVLDSSFDVILCTEVLEHVPDPVAVLIEFSRILKPAGRLIITVPFCSFTHFAPYHFSTGLSRYWFFEHLKKLGFYDIQCIPNGNLFEFIAQEIRRLPAMAVEYTTMKLPRIVLLASIILLKMLQKLSHKDQDSWQFACLGWHVSALKKTTSN